MRWVRKNVRREWHMVMMMMMMMMMTGNFMQRRQFCITHVPRETIMPFVLLLLVRRAPAAPRSERDVRRRRMLSWCCAEALRCRRQSCENIALCRRGNYVCVKPLSGLIKVSVSQPSTILSRLGPNHSALTRQVVVDSVGHSSPVPVASALSTIYSALLLLLLSK